MKQQNSRYLIPGSIFLIIVGALLFVKGSVARPARNEYCPVTISERTDPNIFVDYEGERIHFCCQNCKRKFLSNPEKYMDNLKVSAERPVSDESASHDEGGMQLAKGTHEPTDGHDHSHERAVSQTDSTAASNAGSHADNLDSIVHDPDHAHEPADDVSHDHATNHGTNSNLISFLGRFHPVVIHFPIALVIVAALFVGTRYVLGSEIFDRMAVITMYWAALFAVVAALLGLARGAGAEFPAVLAEYFEWHRLSGLVTAGFTVTTALTGYLWQRSESRKAVTLFRRLLILNVILVGITGHLGATLVFGPNYYG